MQNLWKVKRELARLGQQLAALPQALYEPYLKRRHDRAMESVQPIKGQAGQKNAAHKKIAIYLLYQPKGLSADILFSCDTLQKAGYSVLIVANGGLSKEAIAALTPRVWQILLRPNFGYDFGGYRDGIRTLLRAQTDIERLIILNDSVYFPIGDGGAFIREVEASAFDIGGGILRVRPKRGGGAPERFLESYFYSITARVFHHRDFQQFWDALAITNNKYKVIRRCERGFSSAMRRAGFSVGGLYSNPRFMAALEGASCDELRLCLRYGVFRDPKHDVQCKEMLANYCDSADWHGRAYAFIGEVLEKDGFNSAFCFGAVSLLNFVFLKKSREAVNANWRKAYLAAVRAGDLPPPPKEILQVLEKSGNTSL